MVKINFKNIDIRNIINKTVKMLTIKELLIEINYDIDNIYVDKFWNNIKDNDMKIYLDNEYIFWMGYNEIKRGKESIIKIFKCHFIENEDYKLMNHVDFLLENVCSAVAAEQNIKEEKRGAHNKQYIGVTSDCFKNYVCILGQQDLKKLKNIILS